MSNLFISHSSQDNEAARELEARLAEQEHESVFLDLDPEKGIQAGDSWERTLYRKLRACRAVIALVSDRYLASHWCFAEIALARMEGKDLFVLQIDPWGEDTQMPSILTEEQFINLRSEKEEGYQRLWNGFKVKGIVPEKLRQWGPDEPPYPGLRAFDEEDAPIFFGRDKEVREGVELLNRVRRQGQPRMVAVLGASGSGKSSLTRAGILPRLRRDSARWRVVGPFRPGRRPARELAAALSGAFEQAGESRSWEEILGALDPAAAAEPQPAAGPPDPDVITDQEARGRLLEALAAVESELVTADRTVVESVRRLKTYLGAAPAETTGREAGPPPPGRNPIGELTTRLRLAGGGKGTAEAAVVLVIDQFEELLGHEEKGPDDPANRFLGLLREALRAEDDPPLVLATMRSDFLGLLQRSLPFQEVDFQSLSVGPMPRQGMFAVVTRPADLGGLKLDEGLADQLLTDTETSDALPLLAFTLRVMWDLHHGGGRLGLDHYEALGGIQGAIAQVADETLKEALGLGDERILRSAFMGLARQTAEGTGWTRRPLSWDKLAPEAEPMIQKFVDNRLLVTRGGAGVEVAHEALFRSWETLRGWLDANAEAFRLLREIQVDAKQWEAAPTPEEKVDYLFRGGRLARARELREAGMLDLGDRDLAFIEESHRVEQAEFEAERERERRELRRTRIFLGVVGAAFVGALILAWVAWQQSILAHDKALVAVAAKSLDRDPTRAALVLLELRKPDRAPGAVPLMAEAMTHRLARVELSGHEGPVTSAVFGLRDDEPVILTASRDRTVHTRTLGGEGDSTVFPHSDQVLSAAFHPAGDRFVASLIDGTSHLWTPEALAAGGEPVVLEQGGEIHTAAFSDDGKRIVTASDDGTVRLWTEDGQPVRTAGGQDVMLTLEEYTQANSAAFRPGSHQVLVATNDGTVVLWPGEAGGETRSFPVSPEGGEGDLVRRAAFHPDGTHFVTASYDHSARLWNADGTPAVDEDGKEIVLRHAGPVYDAVFDDDGDRILTASDDGTVRIWSSDDGSPITELDGRPVVLRHANGVSSVRVSADGGSILTACKDGTARVWSDDSAGEPVLLSNQGDQTWVNSAAFGPDGDQILTVSHNGAARLWDVQSGLPLDARAAGASPAPDTDKKPAIWGSGSTTWPLLLGKGHSEYQAMRTVVSPKGDLFLTASQDGTARLKHADGRGVRDADGEDVVFEHQEKINNAAFSRQRDLIVTASDDGTARVWRTDGTALTWPGGGLRAYRTQGRIHLAAEVVLDHADHPVNSAAFDPAGRRVVTTSKDRTARIWNLDGSPIRPGLDTRPYLELPHTEEVFDAVFSPDGRRVVTAWGLRAWIWPATGGEPLARFEGHEDKVRSVAFDSTGRRVATGSEDKTARIWDSSGEADPVVLRGHDDWVAQAAFSPDGDRLVTASWDRDARLWRTTYDGLGVAIRQATPGVCLPPAFRETSLGEDEKTAGKRFERCRTCLADTDFQRFRDCILPLSG